MPLHIPVESANAAAVWLYSPRTISDLDSTRIGYLDELGPANVPADIDTLLARLTAARAGYLDELAAGSMPLNVDILITRLTAARALLLDNLSSVETSGTITHVNGVGEQTHFNITPAELTKYSIVLLDLNALTQNTTIRVKIQVDGATDRLISSAIFPTDFPTNAKSVPIELYDLSVNWKITLQSAVAEGVNRNIPYRRVRRSLV